MKIYLDLLFFLNFSFDFLLLLGVSIVLRRGAKLKRVLLGAFLGSISIFILFFNINSIELFLIKVVISILMVMGTFGYKNINYTFKNIAYLYMISIILGGFLYYLNLEFSYKNEGIIFYHKGISINYIILIIIAPIIIYTYVRQGVELRNNYSNYYNIELYLDEINKLDLVAFLDTGNNLIDPYKKRPVILINKTKINDTTVHRSFLIPYNTIDNKGLLKCIKVNKMKINGKIVTNFLVGMMDEEINIDGVDCILHKEILEGII